MAITYLQEDLTGEYRNVYEKVEIYALSTDTTQEEKDECMMNLLDSLLTAQKAGEPVEKIVGSDVESFCEEYFSSFFEEKRSRWYNVGKGLYNISWVIMIFSLVEMLFQLEDGITLTQMKTDMLGYLVGILVGVVYAILDEFLGTALRRKILRSKKKVRAGLYACGVLMLLVLLVILSTIVVGEKEILVPMLPALLVAMTYVVIWLLGRYHETGSIRRNKKNRKYQAELKEVEKQAEVRQLQKQYVNAVRKQYQSINKKRERKGKALMTPEEFTEWKKKQVGKGWGTEIWFYVGLTMGFLGILYDTAKDGMSLDFLFAVVLLIVIYFGFAKLLGPSFRMEYAVQLFKECEEKGITILEYQIEEERNECK
jgi:DNA-binding ferritin-like protein (Dps family)